MILEGVMNACCKQGIQVAIRFIFQSFLGNLLGMLLVYLVSWKALAILVSFSVANIFCILSTAISLCCSNWENIALYIESNTTGTSYPEDQLDQAVPAVKCCKLSQKKNALVRYLFCMAVGIIIFSVAFVKSSVR